MGEIGEKVILKNKENKINIVFSNSATQGIVLQNDYFDKDIANANNLNGYYIVQPFDFVYNPRISSNAEVGAMNVNYTNQIGLVSPLYTVFRIIDKNTNIDFLNHYFKAKFWHNYMKSIANYGARDDRMNIKDGDFFQMPIKFPTLAEQTKIATFLSKIDERISTQRALIRDLEMYKKGLFKILLDKLDYSNKISLKSILKEYNHRTTKEDEFIILSSTRNGIYIQNEYFSKQTASNSTIGYKIIPKNYATYRSMSDTGDFYFNIQNIVDKGIVSPAYPVFSCIENYRLDFIIFFLNHSENIKKELNLSKQGGTRYALPFSKLLGFKIPKTTIEEQKKIMKIVNIFMKKIHLENQLLEQYQQQKKYLLQKMFV